MKFCNEIISPDMDWNRELDSFYNHSWGFDMDGVKELTFSELFHSPKQRTICEMCGSADHSTCPYSNCLKCGEQIDSIGNECVNCVTEASTTCEICGYQGHSKYNCPYIIKWKFYGSHMYLNSELDSSYNHSWGFDMDGVKELKFEELFYSQRTTCEMCGIADHSTSACPYARCLKVYFSVPGASTICEICGYQGHSKYNCPYIWKWKFYGSTIPFVLPPIPC